MHYSYSMTLISTLKPFMFSRIMLRKNKVHSVSLIYYNHVHNLQADYASLIQGNQNSYPLSKEW